MNKKFSLLFFCLFFLFPSQSKADITTFCNSYDNDYDIGQTTSGFDGVSDYSFSGGITQTSGYIDCIGVTSGPMTFYPSLDRESLDFGSLNAELSNYYIIDFEGNVICYESLGITYGRIPVTCGTMSDGSFILLYDILGSTSVLPGIPLYVVDGKFYLDINEIPVVTLPSTIESSVGSLNFGLAIIIVLLSLGFITMVYNLMKPKKQWQK